MKTLKKIIIGIILLVVTITGINPKSVKATTEYVTKGDFIKFVVKELKLQVDDSSSNQPYIDAAIQAGIITKNTIGTNYTGNLTISDAAVILVNADVYLHGETVNEELLQLIMSSRISDISSVSNARRPYLAKAYALGFIVGSSNGIYTRTRSIKPGYKVSLSSAKNIVKMLNNQSMRSKITDDGQLIRTSNLPEFAKFYPYILADFPNSYYDWEFHFMQSVSAKKEPLYGTKNWVNLKDYAAPVDFNRIGNGEKIWYWFAVNGREPMTAKEVYDLSVDKWVSNAERYLELVFNVNYKTLKNDKDWYKGIQETDWQYGNENNDYRRLNSYIEAAIKNKTIVESKYIGVDKSSIYMCQDMIYIRAHVKYRIISSESLERAALSPIIFTNYYYPNLLNVKLGEWRDCYMTIEVTNEYENCGIAEAVINDYYHDIGVVMK
jgi:hypothetical protein